MYEEYIRGGGENDPIAEQAMRELLQLPEPPDGSILLQRCGPQPHVFALS